MTAEQRPRIVITGIGAVTPLGMGTEPLIDRWSAGECAIADGHGRCDDFDPTVSLTIKQARRQDRFTQLAVVAGDEALASAGYSGRDGAGARNGDGDGRGDRNGGGDRDGRGDRPYPSERIGCVVGTGIGGLASLEREHDVLRDRGPKSVSPLAVPLMMGNSAAGSISMRHDLRGPSFGVVSACAAGAHAIGTAIRMLQAGDADAVVTGGSESAMTPLAEAAFSAMGATSPAGISRPFDARRDGFVMGEGAGILILENHERAIERGAEILGEILGYAASSDAFHLTAPEPEGRGASIAIRDALADAQVAPDQLSYVNAHGTSTPLNDRSETNALKTALGDSAYRIPTSSLKSSIGHLLGAAGAVELIATVEALRRGVAPPTLGYEEPDEGLDLNYVTDGSQQMPADRVLDGQRYAISNSFGFGGHNAVICLAARAAG